MTAPTTVHRPGYASIPVGLCQCGCHERTPLAAKTSRRDGWRKGEPLRFVHGHNARRYAGDRGKGEFNRRESRRDMVLDEWVFLDGPKGRIDFHDFPARVGMTFGAWERMFYRAVDAGDERAVRP